MALRLNQLLAIEKQVRDKAASVLTEAYHDAQKATLVDGFTRTYQPASDDGERFPSEEKILQVRMHDVVKESSNKLVELMDLTLRKDVANCSARASVEVDGVVVIADAPATYLLWLEKKLIDIRTFVSKLPRLSADQHWTWSDAQNCYVADPAMTVKTKKVNMPVVVVPATKEHPAQVAMTTEDTTTGYWTNVKYSGALPANKVADYVARVDALLAAVKQARQKANSVEVPAVDPAGRQVLGFIFG